jgi:hypothetical protein
MRRVAVLVLVLAAGCKAPPPERATVSGVVRFQGKPVPHGLIHFYNKATPTTFDSASIKKDGTYVLTNVPIGPVKVVVQINKAGDPELVRASGGKDENVLPTEIARKYARLETTPLELIIEPGENKYDPEIK